MQRDEIPKQSDVMTRYVSIYRWKPENFIAFGRKWLQLLPSYPGPQKLKDDATKFKQASMSISIANNCLVFVYDLDDMDWIEANICALHLADVCTMETFPALNGTDYAKSGDLFAEVFPDIMAQLTKE